MSFHCTVLTDYSLADQLKPTNSLSLSGRPMNEVFDQHYLTCLIFWSVPPTIQKDKSFVGRHNGTYFHSPAALTNAFTLAADLIIFRLLMESVLVTGGRLHIFLLMSLLEL